jgi:ParB family chromosome partitioning protein
MRIEDIEIALIDIPSDRRVIDMRWAEAISSDMAKNGQITPIEVIATGDRFRLISGAHRIEARKLLGVDDVSASIFEMSEFRTEADLKLREIAENMMRRGLSILDKAWDVWRWREIYESVHGAVKAGRKKNGGKFAPISEDDFEAAANAFAGSFTAAAQSALGLNKDAIKRYLRIASIERRLQERISLHDIADNQSELLALATEPAPRRELIASLLLSEPPKAKTVADAIAIIDQVPTVRVEAWTRMSEKFSKLPDAAKRKFLIEHWEALRPVCRQAAGALDCWLEPRRLPGT